MFLLWMACPYNSVLCSGCLRSRQKSRLERMLEVWDGKHCVDVKTLMLNCYSMVTQLCFHWTSVPSTPLLCCLAIIKCLILVKPGCCWPAVWLCWQWETLGNSQLSSTDWWAAVASWGWDCGWDEPRPQGRDIFLGYIYIYISVCVCVAC